MLYYLGMAKTAFDFELITPEGVLLNDRVTELVAVTETGEIGILNNHAALKSKLRSAPLRYVREDGTKDLVAVLGGVIEVENNKVLVISEFAQRGKDIDEAEADSKAKKAQAELQLLSPSAKIADRDLMIAEARVQKELLLLQTARLRKKL
jgi:F-type H+-transporting ATPase subunit epsilon